jgi:hypothetical protein
VLGVVVVGLEKMVGTVLGSGLDPFLEGFSGSKRGDALLGDRDFFAGARVAADARLSLLNLEYAKIADL